MGIFYKKCPDCGRDVRWFKFSDGTEAEVGSHYCPPDLFPKITLSRIPKKYRRNPNLYEARIEAASKIYTTDRRGRTRSHLSYRWKKYRGRGE